MSETGSSRRFEPRQQLTLLVLGAVIVAAALAVVWFAFLKTDYVVLLSKLRPSDAADIVAQLRKDKTPYRLADNGTTILVPKDLADASRLEIVSTDIPLKGAVGFELFNKSDMGLTDFAQKINYQRALQGELARTIMTLAGVDSARVHLSLPEQSVFQRDQSAAKASVTVIMQPGTTLMPAAVNGIQNLVASAVTDLEAADVVVLDAHGNVISSTLPSPANSTAPAIQQKLAIEQYYAGKIREALDNAGQFANAQVTVLALYDPSGPDTVPSTMAGLGSDGTPATPDLYTDSFSPTGRRFGLRAMLTFPKALAEADARKAVDIVRATISFDAAKGDEVRFGIPIRTAPLTVDTVIPASSPGGDIVTPPKADASVPFARLAWLVLGFVAVVVLTMMLVRQLWRPRLSSAGRRAFSEQLARELDMLERSS